MNEDASDLRRYRAHYDANAINLIKLKLIPRVCIKSLPNISSYSSTVTQVMACCQLSQAIAWTNGDLRLLASILILFFKS